MRTAAVSALIIALLAACGGRKPKPTRLPPPMPAKVGATQQGIASWYGHPYHGRRTSNGEVYDMNKLTAAHLSLPFDTWLRVTNLSNRRDTEVRINDRGPFVKGRIIDLSRAAAEEIEMIGPGTVRIRLEIIQAPNTQSAYVVQIGSFGRRENAEQHNKRPDSSYTSK
jgi:rare lipoprotein A